MILKIEECIEDIKKQIKDFTDIAVIGLSGGADSTLVATLCTLALGKENVYGIEMPYWESYNKDYKEIVSMKSKKLINLLNISSQIHNIHYIVEGILVDMDITENDNTKVLIGNIKARLRMIHLYAKCEELNNFYGNRKVRVIGTDNLSENFIGYFTKYGDGGVDINPIEELYKSEVYQLLDYFKDKGIITEECIDRVPSAGLWEGQTDEGELGITYNDIEKAIRLYKNENKTDCKVYKMHWQTQHKREIPGKFELRKYCD